MILQLKYIYVNYLFIFLVQAPWQFATSANLNCEELDSSCFLVQLYSQLCHLNLQYSDSLSYEQPGGREVTWRKLHGGIRRMGVICFVVQYARGVCFCLIYSTLLMPSTISHGGLRKVQQVKYYQSTKAFTHCQVVGKMTRF